MRKLYGEAAKWVRKAAEQGDAKAQSYLGAMYHQGEGVPQNYIRAYAWLSLAAAQEPKYATRRDGILKLMTPKQIASGQELSIELHNKIEQKTKGNK